MHKIEQVILALHHWLDTVNGAANLTERNCVDRRKVPRFIFGATGMTRNGKEGE